MKSFSLKQFCVDMKIGFDVSDLATNRADGTTRYTLELARRLPEILREEWHYFAPSNPVKSLSAITGSSASRRVQWHASVWPRYWTQSRLPIDLYRYRPDVMFMPIQQIPFIRPGRMKTVAVVHDCAFHLYPEQFTYKDWFLQHVFTAYAVRRADKIIAVSQATADDVAKYYGRRDGVEVVHHGVNHEVFSANPADPPKWREASNPYLLYVGQIQPRKNLVRLIEAFEKLDQKDLQLVIAGSHGWLQKPIFDRIESSSRKKDIVLLGRVSDDLLPALYSQAEAFVLPSLYEGFGMPILEAMACGCPVVTSNVSSMPEVAGKAAVLVDPLNVESIVAGIREALSRKEELKQTGLERAKHFTWDKTARETASIISSVL